jgi:hypothetical protein
MKPETTGHHAAHDYRLMLSAPGALLQQAGYPRIRNLQGGILA